MDSSLRITTAWSSVQTTISATPTFNASHAITHAEPVQEVMRTNAQTVGTTGSGKEISVKLAATSTTTTTLEPANIATKHAKDAGGPLTLTAIIATTLLITSGNTATAIRSNATYSMMRLASSLSLSVGIKMDSEMIGLILTARTWFWTTAVRSARTASSSVISWTMISAALTLTCPQLLKLSSATSYSMCTSISMKVWYYQYLTKTVTTTSCTTRCVYSVNGLNARIRTTEFQYNWEAGHS